jgi:predicted DNA-binding WGR domain protein
MATLQQQVALHREGRLDLAIQAYHQGRFKSVKAAASAYDVPRTTLRDRLAGIKPKLGSIAKNRLLMPTEEETLVQWILSIDQRGMPPTVATVRQMAGLLVSQYGKLGYVGKVWVRDFIKRHETLKSKYNRKYDYQRAKYEDLELIRA